MNTIECHPLRLAAVMVMIAALAGCTAEYFRFHDEFAGEYRSFATCVAEALGDGPGSRYAVMDDPAAKSALVARSPLLFDASGVRATIVQRKPGVVGVQMLSPATGRERRSAPWNVVRACGRT